MKANAILNKMTLEKFSKLSVTFMAVALRDVDVVTGAIDMIVDKAQMEPHFSSMYADLCELIARTPIPGLGEASPGKDANKGSKKFRKMLLLKVQQEFEKDWQGLFVTLQNDVNTPDDEKAEKEFGLKRKYTGHMRFVGELYKKELLKEKHVHAAIHDMFGNADEPDEERLECMVKLLQTCGKKLDQTGSPETQKDMKKLFKRVGKVADGRLVSSRIRFMLRDLIELRKNHWVPRREEEKAKTMQELHNDIAKEEESKNRFGGRGSRPGGSSGSSSIRPGSGDARNSSGFRSESTSTGSRPTGQAAPAKVKDDDGWETVTKPGKGGGGGAADGWSQAPSRSRSSNPGSDERRGNNSSGGSSLVAHQTGFALLGSHDDDKEKKKKKKKDKDSKEKKEKSSKSGKERKKKDKSSSSSKKSSAPSATASAADADAPPPASAAVAVAAKEPMSEETARKKGKDAVAEFAVSKELEEARTCLKEIDPEVRWAAVSGAVSDSLERKQGFRDALGVVLEAGAKEGALSQKALLKGFEDVLGTVPDVYLDVPQVSQYVATALAPLVLGGHLELGPLLASPCESLMEGGKAAEFAVVAIKQVRAAAAAAGGLSEEQAASRVSELLAGALDLPKLAAMLPSICRGDEAKATALLERHGVSL
ncbi:unnamed protein product [Pylaiella littoralis]